MEWAEGFLKFLFGQLGPLGTICLGVAAYTAWLHHQEKEDHKATRKLVAEDAAKRLLLHEKYIAVLTEVKTLIHKGQRNAE